MNADKWYLYLGCAASGTLLIPMMIGIFYWKKLEKIFRILDIGFIVSFILGALMILVGVIMHEDNMYLFIIDSINSCIIYTLFFYFLFRNPKIKKVLLMFAFIVLNLLIYNLYIYFNGSVLQQFSVFIEGVFTVTISILFLTKLMVSQDSNENLKDNPFFWIMLGKIIPTIFSIIISAFTDYLLLDNPNLYRFSLDILNGLCILGNIFFGIGLWKSLQVDTKIEYNF